MTFVIATVLNLILPKRAEDKAKEVQLSEE